MLGGTRKLSDAECGRLFRALLRYSSGEDVELINLQGREEVLFDVYSQQIDRDAAAYDEKCAKNKANGSVRKQSPANGSVRSQYKDKDEYKDKGKEKDKYKDKDEPEAAANNRPDFNTIEVYAANNLAVMNAGNMAEFVAFKDELPEELIRHAIDEACAAGKRTWGYTRAILTRYRDNGFKTVGEAKAAKPPVKSVAASAPVKRNYTERPSDASNYGKNSYTDPTKDLE
jgi:DnaD/phage-associated family protein